MSAPALAVRVDLTAYSKGRPSGIWARLLPRGIHGWFTWGKTELGHVRHVQYELLGTRLILADGALEVTLDRDLKGMSVRVAGIAFDWIELPQGEQLLDINLSAGGFTVTGEIAVWLEDR